MSCIQGLSLQTLNLVKLWLLYIFLVSMFRERHTFLANAALKHRLLSFNLSPPGGLTFREVKWMNASVNKSLSSVTSILNTKPCCCIMWKKGKKKRKFNLLDADNTCFYEKYAPLILFLGTCVKPWVPGIRCRSLPSEFVKHHQRRGWGERNTGVCVPTSREIKQVMEPGVDRRSKRQRDGNEERRERKKGSIDSQSPWCILGVEPGRRN